MFVSVAVENTSYSFDKAFTYRVPFELQRSIQKGMRISVPFGGGNKTRIALVLDFVEDPNSAKIKEIISILDKEPVLSQEMILLASWMKSRYYCTLFDCIRLMLPAGINYKVKVFYKFLQAPENDVMLTSVEKDVLTLINNSKKDIEAVEIAKILNVPEKVLHLNKLENLGLIQAYDSTVRKTGDATQKMVKAIFSESQKLTPRQESVYETLLETGEVSVKDLMYFTGCSLSVIKAMQEKNCVEIFEQEVYRKPKHLKASYDEAPEDNVELSIIQSDAFDDIIDQLELGEKPVSLLYGVTGSGKTSVYLKVIDYVVGKDQDVILMVPEISLTPQTIDLFKSKFGEQVGVFHSGLSLAQRLDEWKRAKNGDCKIAIGTRSAIFAPFSNLGLVVIDEEQEHTYKSEITPRYNAKEIARFRCAYSKAFCLLTSATPSVESYFMAKNGIYNFNMLDVRYGAARLPEVKVVNMNDEEVFGNKTDLSYPLRYYLNKNFQNGKQSIVLLNRRGYHTFARCKKCRTVVTCPHCSISLTLHSSNKRLMCHYCGYSMPLDIKCSECGSDEIDFSGYGTQRAEEALMKVVPNAKVLRIDADSTSAKYSLEKKLDAFSNGEYDIMIGTQMVAKGLNFENVTLVGVISADQSLYSDDFRSNERTFDLITQVVGRSGRGKYDGQAIIQTYIPENAYLRLAAAQDYITFYEMEIQYRYAMLYPPFVDLLIIAAVGENEALVKSAISDFSVQFAERAKEKDDKFPVRLLKPVPAVVAKVQGKYRYKLIIKCKNTLVLRKEVSSLLKEFAKKKEYKEITIYADTNPYSIM